MGGLETGALGLYLVKYRCGLREITNAIVHQNLLMPCHLFVINNDKNNHKCTFRCCKTKTSGQSHLTKPIQKPGL